VEQEQARAFVMHVPADARVAKARQRIIDAIGTEMNRFIFTQLDKHGGIKAGGRIDPDVALSVGNALLTGYVQCVEDACGGVVVLTNAMNYLAGYVPDVVQDAVHDDD
jgi:hypothetical protein